MYICKEINALFANLTISTAIHVLSSVKGWSFLWNLHLEFNVRKDNILLVKLVERDLHMSKTQFSNFFFLVCFILLMFIHWFFKSLATLTFPPTVKLHATQKARTVYKKLRGGLCVLHHPHSCNCINNFPLYKYMNIRPPTPCLLLEIGI